MRYDPAGRLHEVKGYTGGTLTSTTRFLHDGDAMVAEYDGAGAMLARHLHGPDAGADDPLVSYAGSSAALANARFLYPDRLGSIVLRADSAGGSAAIDTYDEYGVPGAGNTGRFQYTGQAWIPELGVYYYKARFYSPTAGRFLQTDPVGYEGQVNLYAYVGDDPINGVDPSGTECEPFEDPTTGRSGARCTVHIKGSGENGEITDTDREEARRLAREQARAFLIATHGQKKEARAWVPPMKGKRGFYVSASTIYRSLRDRKTTYWAGLHPKSQGGLDMLMGTGGSGATATINVYGLPVGITNDYLAQAFLHESIHGSRDEAVAGWSNLMGYSPWDNLHQGPFSTAVHTMWREW